LSCTAVTIPTEKPGQLIQIMTGELSPRHCPGAGLQQVAAATVRVEVAVAARPFFFNPAATLVEGESASMRCPGRGA